MQSHLTSSFADDDNASWYSVCRVPMVEWRLDCENCWHLMVIDLHDTGPMCLKADTYTTKWTYQTLLTETANLHTPKYSWHYNSCLHTNIWNTPMSDHIIPSTQKQKTYTQLTDCWNYQKCLCGQTHRHATKRTDHILHPEAEHLYTPDRLL